MSEQHWSQEHATPAELAKNRHVISVQIYIPAFGKAVALCQCGERHEFTTSDTITTGRLGRPPKKITALQLAEGWATDHAEKEHPRCALQITGGTQ